MILSDTCVESLEAILEFLQSIGKTDVVIAEACATDPTMVAFDNCGYFKLSKKYPVCFLDLHQEGYEIRSLNVIWTNTQIRVTYTNHPGKVCALAFSPDGQKLVSASGDWVTRVWRVADGILLTNLIRQAGGILSVAFLARRFLAGRRWQ